MAISTSDNDINRALVAADYNVIAVAKQVRAALAPLGLDPGGRAACEMVKAARTKASEAEMLRRYMKRKELERRAAAKGYGFNEIANATNAELELLFG